MNRLGIDAEHWLYITQNFESEFKGVVGAVNEVKSKSAFSGTNKKNDDEEREFKPVNHRFLNKTN